MGKGRVDWQKGLMWLVGDEWTISGERTYRLASGYVNELMNSMEERIQKTTPEGVVFC